MGDFVFFDVICCPEDIDNPSESHAHASRPMAGRRLPECPKDSFGESRKEHFVPSDLRTVFRNGGVSAPSNICRCRSSSIFSKQRRSLPHASRFILLSLSTFFTAINRNYSYFVSCNCEMRSIVFNFGALVEKNCRYLWDAP